MTGADVTQAGRQIPGLAAALDKIGPKGAGRMNVEFVSADPTGPLSPDHLAAARVGETVARAFAYCGWKVTREFYVNDCGMQVEMLARALCGLAGGSSRPSDPALARFMDRILARVFDQLGAQVFTGAEENWIGLVGHIATRETIEIFRQTLAGHGIRFDLFTYESDIRASGLADDVVRRLTAQGAVVEDPPASGNLMLELQAETGVIHKPLRTQTWDWTYILGDLAYQADKLRRGYDGLCLVLKPDHSSYVLHLDQMIPRLCDRDVAVFTAALTAPEPVDFATHDAQSLLAQWPDILVNTLTRFETGTLAQYHAALCQMPQTGTETGKIIAALVADITGILTTTP